MQRAASDDRRDNRRDTKRNLHVFEDAERGDERRAAFADYARHAANVGRLAGERRGDRGFGLAERNSGVRRLERRAVVGAVAAHGDRVIDVLKPIDDQLLLLGQHARVDVANADEPLDKLRVVGADGGERRAANCQLVARVEEVASLAVGAVADRIVAGVGELVARRRHRLAEGQLDAAVGLWAAVLEEEGSFLRPDDAALARHAHRRQQVVACTHDCPYFSPAIWRCRRAMIAAPPHLFSCWITGTVCGLTRFSITTSPSSVSSHSMTSRRTFCAFA